MKTGVIIRLITSLTIFVTIQVRINAQRIVSLVPSVTQTLQQIGADDHVVGRTSYCPQTTKGENVVVGDAMTVNLEKIIALKPDAVITMELTSAKTIEKLKALGVNVVEMKTPETFEEICEQTIFLGELAGNKGPALDVVKIEKENIEQITTKAKAKTVFFEIGVKPLWGATRDTYLDDMLRKLGLKNVLVEGNGSTSREHITGKKPQVIVLTTLYGQADEERGRWTKLDKNVTIAIVDENIACCPTPTNYRITLETISKQINK